jgi:hypothetical protein
VAVLLIVWVTGYQSACERALERAQNLPAPYVASAAGNADTDDDDVDVDWVDEEHADAAAILPVAVSEAEGRTD